MKKTLTLVSTLTLLAGCSEIPASAYVNRGDPERLLDISQEVVTMNLGSRGSLSELANMVSQDPPSRAELNCQQGEALCMEAKNMLDGRGVQADFTGSGDDVVLVYERVQARDCEQRYIDNSINPYNLHHPTFGCSVAGNTVQMVSDKRQFVSPSLLDFSDAEKSVQVYKNYLQPPKGSTNSSPGTTSKLITGNQGIGQ